MINQITIIADSDILFNNDRQDSQLHASTTDEGCWNQSYNVQSLSAFGVRRPAHMAKCCVPARFVHDTRAAMQSLYYHADRLRSHARVREGHERAHPQFGDGSGGSQGEQRTL